MGDGGVYVRSAGVGCRPHRPVDGRRCGACEQGTHLEPRPAPHGGQGGGLPARDAVLCAHRHARPVLSLVRAALLPHRLHAGRAAHRGAQRYREQPQEEEPCRRHPRRGGGHHQGRHAAGRRAHHRAAEGEGGGEEEMKN